MTDCQKPLIGILTTCKEDWGGSEELWAKTIPYIRSAGYDLIVYKKNLNKQYPQFIKIEQAGVLLQELIPLPVVSNDRFIDKITAIFKKPAHVIGNADENLYSLLKIQRPELLIVCQGINFDGINMAYICSLCDIPYVIISQKAVEFYWPPYQDRAGMRTIYQKAHKAYFVSTHNKVLTEEQFGFRFSNAEVISNPIKVARKLIPMADTNGGYRLACIGRFFLLDKGQDILIRILSLPKWKARPLTVSFIGTGTDKDGLVELAALLGVLNVEFLDQVEDIAELWKRYHGLVLPARSEGTPLVLLEAMACGRIPIVSTAGGNPEYITDGYNGFIGQPNVLDFDLTLERAWDRREEWSQIGKNGLQVVEDKVPADPEGLLAASILKIHRDLPVKCI